MTNFEFSTNKKILEMGIKEFSDSKSSCYEIIKIFSVLECAERDELCAFFDMFDNSESSSMGTGSEDIMSLCSAIINGICPRHFRHNKNRMLNKIRNFIKNNDKMGLLKQFQSINRAAKDNIKSKFKLESDEKNFDFAQKNPWNYTNDDIIWVKCGNRQKIRPKKQDFDQKSLFDFGGLK